MLFSTQKSKSLTVTYRVLLIEYRKNMGLGPREASKFLAYKLDGACVCLLSCV